MKFYSLRLTAFLFFCLSAFFVISVNAQKPSVDGVIAKHLDSIASKEKRSAVKNQMILTDLHFKHKGNTNNITGKALFLSEGEKTLWGMNLSSNDYPQDYFGYNGQETKVAFTRPGVRSIIGDFIFSHRELLKDGLLGGSLSSAWTLLNNDSKKSKLSYEGTKTIDGIETHVLSYVPKGGSDLSIKMYFDKENYRHIRTEYNQSIGATQGTNIDNSAGQGVDRYRLVEDFSKFTKMGDLTLPSVYKLSYSYSSSSAIRTSQKANREVEWTFNVVNFSFNQKLEDNSFDVKMN